jgi:hypothetical protein
MCVIPVVQRDWLYTMSDRQSHPVCDATYTTPDRAPYEEVGIEFYQRCKPESELIAFLRGLSEVRKVTPSKGRSAHSPSVRAQLLKIELDPRSRTSEACQRVKDQAAEWVYNRGCTHGTPQPKL